MTEASIYRGHPGQHITDAAEKAGQLANNEGRPVTLEFNDACVAVGPWQEAEAVVIAWQTAMDAIAEAYRNSPAGKRSALEAENRLRTAQEAHDKAMQVLPSRFADAKSAVVWLQSFADAADHVGVVGSDFGRAADVLETSGWRNSEACGLPKEQYKDPDTLSRWIIGQAIDMLRKGMPPHPMLMHQFAPQFLTAAD